MDHGGRLSNEILPLVDLLVQWLWFMDVYGRCIMVDTELSWAVYGRCIMVLMNQLISGGHHLVLVGAVGDDNDVAETISTFCEWTSPRLAAVLCHPTLSGSATPPLWAFSANTKMWRPHLESGVARYPWSIMERRTRICRCPGCRPWTHMDDLGK